MQKITFPYGTNKLTKLISTDINNYSYQLISTDTNKVYFWNDKLFDQFPDLVNPQYKSWYCKKFYELGKNKVLELAGKARREGRDPAKYFSQLLRAA